MFVFSNRLLARKDSVVEHEWAGQWCNGLQPMQSELPWARNISVVSPSAQAQEMEPSDRELLLSEWV